MSEPIFLQQGIRLEIFFEKYYPPNEHARLGKCLREISHISSVEVTGNKAVITLGELASSLFEPLTPVIETILESLKNEYIHHSSTTVKLTSDCPVMPLQVSPQLLTSLANINSALSLDINSHLADDLSQPVTERSEAALLIDLQYHSQDEITEILGDPDWINQRIAAGKGRLDFETLWYGGEEEELDPATMLEELVEEIWLNVSELDSLNPKPDAEWRVGWFLEANEPEPLTFELNCEMIRRLGSCKLPLYIGFYRA